MESIKYVGLLHRSSIIIINIMYESRKFSKKITFWTMFSIFRCSSEDNREREREAFPVHPTYIYLYLPVSTFKYSLLQNFLPKTFPKWKECVVEASPSSLAPVKMAEV